MNYRTGIRAQMSNECLIEVANVGNQAQAAKLVGQKVVWTNGKSQHAGRIVGFHGKNGVIRAKFNKGVPGQAIGSVVQLVG